jgi:hypothetical protein
MTTAYSANELNDFLDWAMQKGLLKPETGKSRKVAAQKVLSALDESEREDLRTINVASTFDRFVNKNAKNFTPQSLATYRSRFQSALEDFLRYRENPTSFRFEGQRKTRQNGGSSESAEKPPTVKRMSRTVPPPAPLQPSGVSEVVFPIPIREGVIVRVHNLPNNLTKAEAQRISAVILALAMQ